MTVPTQLDYYRTHQIDPVPIALDTEAKWSAHVAKRRNLYERQLGVPLSLLRGKRVLEFGCNSGQNALVLARAGAALTLVEPNAQMHDRLRTLFATFDQTASIESLSAETIETFPPSSDGYDLIVAEGFLCTLDNRDAMLARLFQLASPGGIVITSYNDSYGMLTEAIKQAILKRACTLASISNWEDRASLPVAEDFFLEEFSKLPASRPFDAWWQDMLVCPLISAPYFWSMEDVLPIAERAGFDVMGTSPQWNNTGHYSWYKAAPSAAERRAQLIEGWRRALPVFLAGMPAAVEHTLPPSDHALAAVRMLVTTLSNFTMGGTTAGEISVPEALSRYIAGSGDDGFRLFGRDLDQVPGLLASADVGQLKSRYESLNVLRAAWGMPYHYLSFIAE